MCVRVGISFIQPSVFSGGSRHDEVSVLVLAEADPTVEMFLVFSWVVVRGYSCVKRLVRVRARL